MRHEMGPVELVGWMILGGWLGFVLCSLTTNGFELLLNALGGLPWSLGYGGGALVYFLFIGSGVAAPIVIYYRRK